MEKRQGIGKGTPGPGRRKGEPNKVTQATREAFKMLVDGQFDNLNSWINDTAKDSPKDAFYMVMDLASFCLPRLKAVELTGGDGKALTLVIQAPGASTTDQ